MEDRYYWIKGYWKKNPKMSWRIIKSGRKEEDFFERINKFKVGDWVRTRGNPRYSSPILDIRNGRYRVGPYWYYESDLTLTARNLKLGRPHYARREKMLG